MAANTKKLLDPGFWETIFPLCLTVSDKAYKILVKNSLVKIIFDNIEKFSKEFVTLLPDPPNDPIYLDIMDDHVVVPSLTSTLETDTSAAANQATATYQATTTYQATASNQAKATYQVTASNQARASNQDTETYRDEADEDEDHAKRFDWKMSATRKLLSILIDKRKETSDFALSKKVWPMVADEIKQARSYQPSATQCREKFYSLKRSYRHFLMESKKTGNRRRKPFIFETEMQSILENGPSFKPIVMRSSFGANEINNNNVEDTDEKDDDETASTSSSRSSTPNPSRKPKGKKRKLDELKDFLTERDKEFFKQINEMQQKTNNILEKLVEKL